MKQILLFVTSMLFAAAASVAQPARGPQGHRNLQGFRQHHGPRVEMKMMKLTNEEVATRFAHMLHLDEAKAAAFTPVAVDFIAERAEVNVQHPMKPRQMFQRPMHKEQPTEAQITEMKAQHKQMVAKHKAMFSLNKEFKPKFLEVINGRQYHHLMRLIDDRRMYVKFVRVNKDQNDDENENTDDDEQLANTRSSDRLADAIESVNNDNDGKGEWYTINGVTLKGHPTQTGIYVNNGKKVLLR